MMITDFFRKKINIKKIETVISHFDNHLYADVVVWVTPIYYFEMSGQMKILIDRLNPMYSKDYKFRDVYLLATAAKEGDNVFEKVITGINSWIDCFERTSIKGTVLCGGDISGNNKLKEAYNLGSRI